MLCLQSSCSILMRRNMAESSPLSLPVLCSFFRSRLLKGLISLLFFFIFFFFFPPSPLSLLLEFLSSGGGTEGGWWWRSLNKGDYGPWFYASADGEGYSCLELAAMLHLCLFFFFLSPRGSPWWKIAPIYPNSVGVVLCLWHMKQAPLKIAQRSEVMRKVCFNENLLLSVHF